MAHTNLYPHGTFDIHKLFRKRINGGRQEWAAVNGQIAASGGSVVLAVRVEFRLVAPKNIKTRGKEGDEQRIPLNKQRIRAV